VYVDALILRDRDTDGNGSLDERLWVQQDANWNVTAVVDGTGVVQERYAYDPFGQATMLTPSYGSRSGSSYGWVYLHQGLRYEAAVGLYDNRMRWYSPSAGRFVTTDPLGFGAGDVSLYRYVGNGPVSWIDPDGLQEPARLPSQPSYSRPRLRIYQPPASGSPPGTPNPGVLRAGLSLTGAIQGYRMMEWANRQPNNMPYETMDGRLIYPGTSVVRPRMSAASITWPPANGSQASYIMGAMSGSGSAVPVVAPPICYPEFDPTPVNSLTAGPGPGFVTDPVAQREYEAYKRRCSEPTPGHLKVRGQECERARWEFDRNLDCMIMRQAWDDRWMPGRHAQAIQELERGIIRLAEWHYHNCP
jgi:RHS repeat-associated protein